MSWDRSARALATMAILLMLQFGLKPLLGWRAPIDFLVIGAILAAVRLSPGPATVVGTLLGLLADSVTMGALGSEALALGGVAFAASWLRAVFFADSILLNGVLFLVGKWVMDLLLVMSDQRLGAGTVMSQLLIWSPLAAINTALAGMALMLVLRPLIPATRGMSFHPNDVAARARTASAIAVGAFGLLFVVFAKTQVLEHQRYALASEGNRLRGEPVPAARGPILDRNGAVIAETIPGYAILLTSTQGADSLRETLLRLRDVIPLSDADIDDAIRRFQHDPVRPIVVRDNAPFTEVAKLEERSIDYPGLIIQSSPKRYYPAGSAVGSFVGYTGEINERELDAGAFPGYKAGQQVGRTGLEKQYEAQLRGKEGTRFVEVDARQRVVRSVGARQDIPAEAGQALHTNIDLDLQRFLADSVFGDSLVGGAMAMDPRTGEVLALHSAPSYDPNIFTGGISQTEYDALNNDPRHPLYNKVIQGQYPPGSTWKLVTAVAALEAGVVTLDEKMPQPCTGGYAFGNRFWRCWEHAGHGDLSLSRAIEVSCDVYFYQLGLKMTLTRLLEGGGRYGLTQRSGIDLPGENPGGLPTATGYQAYFNKRYGKEWDARTVVMNMAIGQGENVQTVASMSRFYTAFVTGGVASRPEIGQGAPQRDTIFRISEEDLDGLRKALAGVISPNGTAASAMIPGAALAGKTGTAQVTNSPDHGWFVGYAPADAPTILVGVMLENREHGYLAARVAKAVIEHYLKRPTVQLISTDG